MKSILILIGVMFVLFGSGCNEKTSIPTSTSNPTYTVQLLFELDGCKVYRFDDAGHWIYYSTCRGGFQWYKREGKTTRRHEVVTEDDAI